MRSLDDRAGDPFATAFRTTRMAMIICDPRRDDMPIVFVNDAFLKLSGYGRDEILGRNCRFLQGRDTDPQAIAAIRAAVAAEDGIELEILNYRKDGTPFWNALVISPVHDENGQLVYFFASQFDVSAKKSAELELVRAKQDLEEEVRRRTLDLQAALDQKTLLLHEVDHRVKNNLQVVASLVLLKARRVSDKGAQRVLHNMAERVGALSTVHRLLYSIGDVSRFELSHFVRDLVADLTEGTGAHRIDVVLNVEPVAIAAAKAAPLALLINELITNALKHAFPDQRPGVLTVQAVRDGALLRLAIADDGIGMQALAAADEGFGRTLVELLVRQLKGTLAYEDVDRGTRAVVSIPLDRQEIAG
jgi:PAS domain S-box-containing protein